MAQSSREAFQKQPTVSPYFEQPLIRLEEALAAATAARARAS